MIKKTKKKSDVEGADYWKNRKLDDSRRDWEHESPTWVSGYWGSQAHPHRKLIVEAFERLGVSNSVLEVGCNCGPNLQQIRNKFPNIEVFGVDISEEAIKEAGNCMPGNFQVGSVIDISLPDGSVQVVLADAVLMYIGPEEIEKAISEITRVSGDAVIICDWFDKSELGVVKDGHWARDYSKLLEKQGFLETEKHKLTEEEWPNKKWATNGYVSVYRRA